MSRTLYFNPKRDMPKKHVLIEIPDSDDEDFVPSKSSHSVPAPKSTRRPSLPPLYKGKIDICLDLTKSEDGEEKEKSFESSSSSSSSPASSPPPSPRYTMVPAIPLMVPATPLGSPRSVPTTPGRAADDEISHSAATMDFSLDVSQYAPPQDPADLNGDDGIVHFAEHEPVPFVASYDPLANEIKDGTQDVMEWFNTMNNNTAGPASPLKAAGTFNKSFFEEVVAATSDPASPPLLSPALLSPAVRTFTPGSYLNRAPAPIPAPLFEESIPDPMDIVVPSVPLTPPEPTQPTQVFDFEPEPEPQPEPAKVARTEVEEDQPAD